MTDLSFDRLVELVSEEVASKLLREPRRADQGLMTVAQAAAYLGSTIEGLQHLLRLVRSGTLPSVPTERGIFFDRMELDKWMEDNLIGWA